MLWAVEDARPYGIVVYVAFGCRGRRPRRPVRCLSNYAVCSGGVEPRPYGIVVHIMLADSAYQFKFGWAIE